MRIKGAAVSVIRDYTFQDQTLTRGLTLITVRLWGWRENAIEVSRAEKEPGYGTDGSKSDMDAYMQGVAHRNSAYSQLKFSESIRAEEVKYAM